MEALAVAPQLEMIHDMQTIRLGNVVITPVVDDVGYLRTLGEVEVGGQALCSGASTFMPWIDTFDGVHFDRFRWGGVREDGRRRVVDLVAVGRHDYPFQERRDMSGDLCLRATDWDRPPVESDVRIVFEPVDTTIDDRCFAGFRYWFEYNGGPEIHRLLDRQTWAPGGCLDDHQICCRNWTGLPRARIGVEDGYSTAGLDVSREAFANVNPMPGNLWARWSLLPGFDMVYGRGGVLLGWYDRVTLVRSVIETLPGERSLRIADLHLFEKSSAVATNPKTIAWCSDTLDDVDALNLWTRMTDRDREMSQRQFGIRDDGPPRIEYAKNVWVDMNFDTTYEDVVDVASDLGAEVVFVDPIWEHAEAFNMEVRRYFDKEALPGSVVEKRCGQTMCCTMDFKVAEVLGGEAGLKRLCDRAREKGVDILSWMATHMSPVSNFREHGHPELRHGEFGAFAARESGRHPDTGYPGDCWPLNLNAPIREYVRDQLLGVCNRTGLAGFLWDSFSNLGWWQVDYSDGSMRPQFDRMAELYAILSNAGLYLMPEALVAFSNHSCLCLLNAEMVAGDLEGFMYNSVVNMPHTLDGALVATDKRIIKGEEPIDALFRAFAHKWVPNSEIWQVPKAQWHTDSSAEIRRLYATYKAVRDRMERRTVLKGGRGVRWDNGSTDYLLFCFADQAAPSGAREALDGTPESETLRKNRAYLIEVRPPRDV